MAIMLSMIVSCTISEESDINSNGTSSDEETSEDISDETSDDDKPNNTNSETSNDNSDNTSDENGNYSIENMLDALIEYGFIKDDEAKIALKDGITRSQALKIVLRLTNTEDYALETNWESGETPKHTFTDINTTDEIDLYASCALHIGLIKDSGDHLFRGNDNIKANEFISWLLRALDFGDDFGHFDPKSPWELSNQIGLTSGKIDLLTFEDVIRYSFTVLKTQMKNNSYGAYYYYFVYKRIDVEYPNIFHEKRSDYLMLDKFDSFETLSVDGKEEGIIYYPDSQLGISFTILDPDIVSFELGYSNKIKSEFGDLVQQYYKIKGLKEGRPSVKVTFEDKDRKSVAFVNIVVTEKAE